ncbi:[FeFe] hydrogenase H-cluster maturation GTPase HydF [Succinispira mobilis]|uniref:[FeFe] hydrogenase H-cluster maturation GTPase HydF n=1 Tax=Succinispira mobilis TaxID=78120 RepID=UPI0003806817|nr:[FeFe] hydrogenase H-cluster maturation GTPase HydF [Succinispira mobilis]
MLDTPKGNRLHIAIFGKTNSGKSSLINSITGQEIAIVSDIAGTTTDPVSKAMEILPIGPVLIIDTAGLDDNTELGSLRVKKSYEVLAKADIVLLVVDAHYNKLSKAEEQLIKELKAKKIPYLIVLNKIDAQQQLDFENFIQAVGVDRVVFVSAKENVGIEGLKEVIVNIAQEKEEDIGLLEELVKAKDLVVLVTPIDSAAPQGRLILPQVQVLRDILDRDAMAVVVKEQQLEQVLKTIVEPPKLVITDSQVFNYVDSILPKDWPLTSFSILFARQKGNLDVLIKGAEAIEALKEGDRILIAEACTHYRTHEDIGTIKIPHMLEKHCQKNFNFEHVIGYNFNENLNNYALIIHCGACMLNRANMLTRLKRAQLAGVPMVNYGLLIAYLNGILARSIEPFMKTTKRGV